MTDGDGAAAARDGRHDPTRPLVGVGVILFRGDAVLMVRRARPPLAGAWSFPGGAQELGETVVEAGRREAVEETGLRPAGPLALVGHVDAIHRDSEGAILFHYTILDLAGFAPPRGEPVAASDVSEARFVTLAALASLGVDEAHRTMAARAATMLGVA